MASDFHTHFPAPENPALISGNDLNAGNLVSLEVHPWYLPNYFDARVIPDMATLQPFTALGEIGLDKLRGPEPGIQIEYFTALLKLAADCRKPVVIHCVRSFQEIFNLLKPFNIKVLFHGFRSSPELLDELWKRKFAVSFHPAAQHTPALMSKLSAAKGIFGFESDSDPDISISGILNSISEKYRIKQLEKITDQNFLDFLEI